MKISESFIVGIIIVSLSFKISAQNNQQLKVFSAFHERYGLSNFFSKALRGDSVTVAYLGGSITAQEGYRVLSFNWIK